MKKGKWLFLGLCATGTMPLTESCADNSGQQKQLNIVYIMCDDHSYQTISAYDTSYITTPNIDRIAQIGSRFTNSFVSNSLSGPSRACMLTGKHSHSNGFINNETTFNPNQQTFPKLLQEAGYQTAMVGKWHLVSTPEGFDYWRILDGQGQYYNPDILSPDDTIRYNGYVTDIVTDIALDWLAEREQERPFCLLLHHKAPHRAWEPDLQDLELFNDRSYPLPENFFDPYTSRPAAAHSEMGVVSDLRMLEDLKIYTQKDGGEIKKYPTYRFTKEQKEVWDAHYDSVNQKFNIETPRNRDLIQWKYDRYMRDYLRCIVSVDRNVGRVLDYLEENGLMENTVIIYTSDQGFYMGEHGWFDKRFMYEESLRTPLLIYYPGNEPSDVDLPVQNIDYAPTFLQIAGVKEFEPMQGESLLPILRGEKIDNWRDAIYYHYYEFPAEHAVRKHFGIRTSRYKLIRFYSDSSDSAKIEYSWLKDKEAARIKLDYWELYDLERDPSEMENIYGYPEYEDVAEELKRQLKELQAKYGESEFWRD